MPWTRSSCRSASSSLAFSFNELRLIPPLPPSPLCPVLEGRQVTVPIEADFRGNTYGLGTVLAGGWNN